jgi:hypothetical protein
MDVATDRGLRRNSMDFEEIIEQDPVFVSEVALPMLSKDRTTLMGVINPNEPQAQKNCERRHEIIINSIALYYYSIQTASFLDGTPETQKKLDRINAEAYRLIITYEDSFKRLPMVAKSQYINAAREECKSHFNFMTELYTWADWLHSLDKQFGPEGSTAAYDIANIKYDTTDNALGIADTRPITGAGQ